MRTNFYFRNCFLKKQNCYTVSTCSTFDFCNNLNDILSLFLLWRLWLCSDDDDDDDDGLDFTYEVKVKDKSFIAGMLVAEKANV